MYSMNVSYISQLLNEQKNLADFRMKAYIMDPTGHVLPQRGIYSKLYGHFDDYIDSHKNPRLISMT